MSSIVLELQKDLLDKDCDILQALRKANVIVVKLHLTEFDAWIQKELNGYKTTDNSVPEYRKIKGTLKAKNPRRGWIPAIIVDKNNEALFNNTEIYESLSALIDIKNKSTNGTFHYSYPPDVSMQICKQAGAPV